ncbi:MAG: thioredoxin domain-containing protein [Nitrospinae bacterium]|nr:thioredoxin domain-containing protein [Nitrospinota bacterium]
MRPSLIEIFFLSVVFLFCGLTAPLYAEIYKWKDENGSIHFTEDPAKIPPQFRTKEKVETIEMEGSSESLDYPCQNGLPDGQSGNTTSAPVAGKIKRISKDRVQAYRKHYDKHYKKMSVSLRGLPRLGRRSAPVAIVEFTDYQCPSCRKYVFNTFQALKSAYIDKGKVKYLIRDFPLDFHKLAPKAAEAAHCAGDQGKYWEMHHAIFSRRGFRMNDLFDFGKAIGLNTKNYKVCMKSNKHRQRVERSFNQAKGRGINATPSFVVGKYKAGKVTGYKMSGSSGFKYFSEMIEFFLAQ